jgi:hypothetical protein
MLGLRHVLSVVADLIKLAPEHVPAAKKLLESKQSDMNHLIAELDGNLRNLIIVESEKVSSVRMHGYSQLLTIGRSSNTAISTCLSRCRLSHISPQFGFHLPF